MTSQHKILIGLGIIAILGSILFSELRNPDPSQTSAIQSPATAETSRHSGLPELPANHGVMPPSPPGSGGKGVPMVPLSEVHQRTPLDPKVNPPALWMSETREEKLARARKMGMTMLSPILSEMGLDSGTIAKVIEAHAQHQATMEEGMYRVQSGGAPPNMAELKANEQARDQATREALGDDVFADFENRRQTRVERDLVRNIGDTLTGNGSPLNEDQRADLLAKTIANYAQAKQSAPEVSKEAIRQMRINSVQSAMEQVQPPLSPQQQTAAKTFLGGYMR